MSSPLVHIEITGRDGKKLQDFFSGLFGWQMNADNPMNYGVFNLSDDVAGGVGPGADGSDGMSTFYIGVDDVEATLQQAESLGGKRLWGPMDVPEGPTIAQFADPEGHPVGLFKRA
jgi:predicted enzyme related to lactoylglutathione lyase